MSVRDGNWVTPARIRAYSLILLVMMLLVYGYLLATSQGAMDRFGRPLGTDFSNIYTAGNLVNQGTPAAPFTPTLQERREKEIFGPGTQFYSWHYPPVLLPLAAALASLPYLLALGVWLFTTGGLYVAMMGRLLPVRGISLAALAFPAAFVNIGHGNNGFLTAALFGFAVLWLKHRPVLAGICFGLLAYKPQFGLLIPLALLAGGHWRSFAAATVTVALMIGLTLCLYGPGVWEAFLAELPFTQHAILYEDGVGFYKMQSLFAALRLWGAGVDLASAAQLGLVLGLIVTLWRCWCSEAAEELKYAALILACFMATPYSVDYDLMLVAPAIALLVKYGLREGFAPYEKSLLVFAFLSPLITRVVAQHALIPLGLISVLLLYVSVLHSIRRAPSR